MKNCIKAAALALALLLGVCLCACSSAESETTTTDATTDATTAARATEEQKTSETVSPALSSTVAAETDDGDDEDEEEDEYDEEQGSAGLALAQAGETYVVTGLGACTDTDIVIPARYKGKPVVSITTYAFAHTAITSVVIPSTVEKIAECAFMECVQMKSVTLNEGLKMIDCYAFDHCESLTGIVFPASLETIEYTSFSMCCALKKVTFLGNTSVGGDAFDDCENLSEVIFAGKDAKEYTIGFNAFTDSKIETIALPEGLTDIDGAAFFGMQTLKTVYLPKTLRSLWDDSFAASGVEMIYYAGSTDDWAKITKEINQYNIYEDPLETKPIVYNYSY